MKQKKGFTLIELVMVIVILGIMAAVALPTFFNLQVQAREAAFKGAIGGIRSAVAIWYAKEAASTGTASYPTIGQLTAVTNGAFGGGRVPGNPYVAIAASAVIITSGTAEPGLPSAGWVYDDTTGRVWGAASNTVGSGW